MQEDEIIDSRDDALVNDESLLYSNALSSKDDALVNDESLLTSGP